MNRAQTGERELVPAIVAKLPVQGRLPAVIANLLPAGRKPQLGPAVAIVVDERERIGYDLDKDRARFRVTDEGIVVIAKEETIGRE